MRLRRGRLRVRRAGLCGMPVPTLACAGRQCGETYRCADRNDHLDESHTTPSVLCGWQAAYRVELPEIRRKTAPEGPAARQYWYLLHGIEQDPPHGNKYGSARVLSSRPRADA